MAAISQASGGRDSFGPLYRGWLLTLVLLTAAFGYIDRVIVQTLAQPIKEDLGLSDFQLGMLSGLGFAILYSTLGLPIARLAERRSRVTIISVSVALFSGFTVLCGMAGNFVQLFLCRIGVGIGEAGVQSPSVSLLADHFPAERRGRAMTIMKLGSPVGSFCGALAAGYIAQEYGWRTAIMVVAGPGILVAILFKFTLREPQRGMCDETPPDENETPPPLGDVLRMMWDRPEFRHMIIALALVTMGLFGGGAFVAPFFMRVHGLPLDEAAVYIAILTGIAASSGFAFGGFTIDFIGRRSARWYGLLPAIGVALSVPFYLLGYGLGDPRIGLAFQICGGASLFFHQIPTLVAFQNMVTARMRATAAFVFFFVSSLLGIGLGPPIMGFVSDVYASMVFGGDFGAACSAEAMSPECTRASAQGVRYALMSGTALYAWAAIHFYLASRRMASAQNS